MSLRNRINKEILPKLASETSLNVLSLPNISKTVISVGLGPFRDRKDVLESISNELGQITGQKPQTTIAKKSIAGFKLREGEVIGYKVTLRGRKMWNFIDKLINIVLPRIRDFDGVDEKSFDSTSNLTISVKEQIVFPEIKHDDVKENWGMGITFTLKSRCERELVKKYFSSIGLIFKQE